MRKKKALLNTTVSFLCQFLIVVLGVVIPRIFLTNYGSDTNGLIGTISQIFTYISLLEAGISQAARNRLYKPITDNDRDGISFWMSVARRYYRKISGYYCVCVLIIAVLMPIFLKTDIAYTTVFLYIIFEGLTGVVSFYFINTWTCFLNANGETYITNIVNTITVVLCYIVKIILALLGVNIVFIQIGYFVVSLIKLLLYRVYIGKKYTWIKFNIAPADTKLPDRNAYIVSEITWTIFSSTDMVVLSVFIATAISSVYSVYNMIYVALGGLLNSVYLSLTYNLGYQYHENIDEYPKLHDAFNTFFMMSITVLMSVTYLLILPFVNLYTAGVYDVEYINYYLPLLFCGVQMLTWSRNIGGYLIGIAGRQEKAVKINIIEAAINVILSVVLVNVMGIVGVLLATVLALPLKVIYCNYVSDIYILNRKPWRTISILGVNYLIFAFTVILKPFIRINVNSYADFFGYGVILFTVITVVAFLLNSLVNKDFIKAIKKLIKP